MYKITLSNFRGCEASTIEISPQGVMLLDGPSGAGKSTLLDAISFALYDGANNSCYPRGHENDKTMTTLVQIIFPNNFSILRQRRPNLLRVEVRNTEKGDFFLLDDAAQEYINKIFGSVNFWLTGGYLQQGELCSFLTMTAAEKMKFLQEIAPTGNFDKIMAIINSLFEKSILEQNSSKVAVEAQKSIYLDLYNKHVAGLQGTSQWSSTDIENFCKQHDFACTNSLQEIQSRFLSKYHSDIELLRQTIQQKSIELATAKQVAQQREGISLALKEKEEKLTALPDRTLEFGVFETKLTAVTTQIISLQSQQKKNHLKARHNDLGARLALLTGEPSIYKYENLLIYEKLLSGVPLQTALKQVEEVKKAIEYHNAIQVHQNFVSRKREYNLLVYFYTKLINSNYEKCYVTKERCIAQKQKLVDLLSKCPENSLEPWIEALKKLKNASRKLNCPKCAHSLYLNNDHLEVCPPDAMTETSESLDQRLNVLQIKQDLFLQRPNLMSQLEAAAEGIRSCDKEEARLNESKYLISSTPGLSFPDTECPRLREEEYIPRIEECAKMCKTEPIVPDKPTLTYNLEQLKTIQGNLEAVINNLKLIPSEITMTKIAEEKTKHNMQKERERINEEIVEIDKELAKCDSIEASNSNDELNKLLQEKELIIVQLEELKRFQNQRHQIVSERDLLRSQLASFGEGASISLLQKELDSLNEKHLLFQNILRTGSKDLEVQILQNELRTIYDKHTQLLIQLGAIERKLACLLKLRAILITAEYVLLDQVLDKVNRCIAEVLEPLFIIDPITVELKSLRQLKSTDRVKPEINMEIRYKNCEFSTLGKLSWGERGRISLAMMIAFSKFSRMPFIFLDESLSCLDVTTKENAINVLRGHLGDRLALVVNHDTTEGIYDSVIHIDY